MGIKAIIFDMDGVIIDSEDYFKDEMIEFFISHGVDEDYEFSELFGKSIREIFEELRPLLDKEMTYEEFWEEYKSVPNNIYLNKCELRSHMKDIFEKISQENYDLVLCTSSGHQTIDTIFRRFSLGRYFDLRVSAQDIDGKGKPAPKIYEEAADRVNVMPEECLVVEDADKGIESAHRAGMKVVGLTGTAGQSLEKADIIAENGKELNQILSKRLSLS